MKPDKQSRRGFLAWVSACLAWIGLPIVPPKRPATPSWEDLRDLRNCVVHSYSYDVSNPGQLVSVTEYDASGRIVSITDYSSNQPSSRSTES